MQRRQGYREGFVDGKVRRQPGFAPRGLELADEGDLLTCAKQLHDGEKTCSSGAAALVVMGDGGGQWLADLNPQLKKLGRNTRL